MSRSKHLGPRSGFSLLELLTCTAIVGILSSIAVPHYSNARHEARRAEPVVNLPAIANAEIAYAAFSDNFLPAKANPSASVSRQTHPWEQGKEGWADLGWRPSGDVRCVYEVGLTHQGTGFDATATCDIDGDGDLAVLTYHAPRTGVSGYLEAAETGVY